ncbi:MAG: hypothetical protein ABII09_04375 [Planctomycetota bacterium]
MELPDKLKIHGILTQGGAFKAKLPKDSYPRYYFILNRNPEADEKMVLLSSTTKFEEHRNCDGGNDVHIPLSRQDYDRFTQNCLVCCNRPQIVAKKTLEERLASQRYELLPALPAAVTARILRGIAKSNVVDTNVKKMVLGEE